MKKRMPKRLVLGKDTLRSLEDARLGGLAGGTTEDPPDTRDPTACTRCYECDGRK